jgi:hypothetical protein
LAVVPNLSLNFYASCCLCNLLGGGKRLRDAFSFSNKKFKETLAFSVPIV